MGVNEKHKNSVFSLLFSDEDILRELYSAIEGVELPPDTAISINTLSNALLKGQINDVSFTVGGRMIVLIEHQSTINPNMPLRLLMYVARVYEKITDHQDRYKTTLEPIPEPTFIVLYNCQEACPEHSVHRLSDAFRDTAGLRSGNGEGPALELVVHVYNINQGYNAGMLEKCETLGGYSVFISKIWEFRAVMELEEAVIAAVRHCVENDILKMFLETNSTEVINMLFAEWNQEEALAVRYKEGMEAGVNRGRQEGRNEGRQEGMGIGVEKKRQELLALLDKGYTLEDLRRELTRTETASGTGL